MSLTIPAELFSATNAILRGEVTIDMPEVEMLEGQQRYSPLLRPQPSLFFAGVRHTDVAQHITDLIQQATDLEQDRSTLIQKLSVMRERAEEAEAKCAALMRGTQS